MKVMYNIELLRKRLHLSTEYVANYLDISLTDYLALECGDKNPSVREFSRLQLLFGERISLFSDLSTDEREIESLRRWQKIVSRANLNVN